MRSAIIGLVISLVTGCSANNELPPLADIQRATLAYTNCVDKSARDIASQQGDASSLARKVVEKCQDLRREALRLKSVPVMFTTTTEFDAVHSGGAQRVIESVRGPQHAPNK